MTTDFHSHILPGIDDGSTSVEMSVAMLERLSRQGIRHVVATPHFYAHRDTPQAFLARRTATEAALRQALALRPELPAVTVGAEVYYFAGMSNADALTALTIGDTPYILVEMPAAPWDRTVYRELENIRTRQGLIPIIAHIDRYITPWHQRGIPETLNDMELPVQANGSFFCSRRTRRLAMKLLQADQIQLLGSDCHDLAERGPNLDLAQAAIRKHLGEEPLVRLRRYAAQVLTSDGHPQK